MITTSYKALLLGSVNVCQNGRAGEHAKIIGNSLRWNRGETLRNLRQKMGGTENNTTRNLRRTR